MKRLKRSFAKTSEVSYKFGLGFIFESGIKSQAVKLQALSNKCGYIHFAIFALVFSESSCKHSVFGRISTARLGVSGAKSLNISLTRKAQGLGSVSMPLILHLLPQTLPENSTFLPNYTFAWNASRFSFNAVILKYSLVDRCRWFFKMQGNIKTFMLSICAQVSSESTFKRGISVSIPTPSST